MVCVEGLWPASLCAAFSLNQDSNPPGTILWELIALTERLLQDSSGGGLLESLSQDSWICLEADAGINDLILKDNF